MRNRFFLLLFVSFSSHVLVAQNFDTIKVSRTELAPGMYLIQGWGGNILASTGDDGVFLIDDQMEDLSGKIKSSLAEVSSKSVNFIFNTHFHYDHSDGNKAFGPEGSVIMAHENSRKRMTTDQLIAHFKHEQKAYTGAALPKITFTDSMSLHINGQDIKVVHVDNAHTDGDAILYFKQANIIHTGDIFVTYGFPFIDVPNGGSVRGLIKSVDHMLSIIDDKTKIVPGHGSVSSKADLVVYRDMLKTITDRVNKEISNGRVLKDIDIAIILKGYEEVGGMADSAFVMFVYTSLLSQGNRAKD